MSRNFDNILRYLKTYLNNTNYSVIALDDRSDNINIPLYDYLNEYSLNNSSFTVNKTLSNKKLSFSSNDLSIYGKLLQNPLFDAKKFFDSERLLEWTRTQKEFIKTNSDYVKLEMHSKLKYMINLRNQSAIDTSFYICYGLMNIKALSERKTLPILAHKVKLKADDSIICTFLDKPFINLESIRKIPNISAHTLDILKKLAETLEKPLTKIDEVNRILSQVYEALSYTKHTNLSIINSTSLYLVNDSLDYGSLTNYSLENKDVYKDSLLSHLMSTENNINEVKTVEFDDIDEVVELLKEERVVAIDKFFSHYNSSYMNDFLLSASKISNDISIISKDKFLLDKYRTLLKNGLKEFSLESAPHLERQYKSILDRIDKEVNAFTNENLEEEIILERTIDTSKLDYEELWQDNVVYKKSILNELNELLNDLVIEEFKNFSFLTLIAENCKDSSVKSKWNVLVTAIEDYFEYKKIALENSTKVVFNSHISNYDESILAEILEYLDKHNSLPGFHIGMKNSWRALIQAIKVDKKTPKTIEDFIAITDILLEKKALIRLKELWNSLLLPLGVNKISDDAEYLNKALNTYYMPIKKATLWYEETWSPFFKKLIDAGFNWHRFLNEYMNIYIENGLIYLLSNGGAKELKRIINYQMMKISQNDAYLASYTETEDNNLLAIDEVRESLLSIYDKGLKKANYKESSFATLQWSNLEKILLTSNGLFDLVIIDSASSLTLPDLVLLSYFKRAIIIGDPEKGLLDPIKFENYYRILTTLLPNIYPDYFSGEYTLNKIIHTFIKRKYTKKELLDLNPCLASLLTIIAREKDYLTKSYISHPLIFSNIDYSQEWLVQLLAKIADLEMAKDETLSIFVSDEKLAKALSNEMHSISLAMIYSKHNIERLPSSTYLLILDLDNEISLDKKHLYFLAGKAKKHLAYIHNKDRSPKVLAHFDSINNPSFSKDDILDAILHNKNIYFFEDAVFESIKIDYLILAKRLFAVFSKDNIENVSAKTLATLMKSFNIVVYKNGIESLESLFQSFESIEENSLLTSLLDSLAEIEEKEMKNIRTRDNRTFEAEDEDLSDDLSTRDYIIQEKSKPDEITIESIGDTDEIFIKSDSTLFSDEDSSAILPKNMSTINLDLDNSLEDKMEKEIQEVEKEQASKEESFGEESFDIIKWLKENEFTYYDLRPQESLFILDSKSFRENIGFLHRKGFKFSLAFQSDLLPKNENAWKLDDR